MVHIRHPVSGRGRREGVQMVPLEALVIPLFIRTENLGLRRSFTRTAPAGAR